MVLLSEILSIIKAVVEHEAYLIHKAFLRASNVYSKSEFQAQKIESQKFKIHK